MSGVLHYLEAQAQAQLAEEADERGDRGAFAMHTTLGRLHATLAVAAVTALAGAGRYGLPGARDWEDWYLAVTGQPPADDEATP